ncbi:MAG: alpha/beta hydrolase-fold protein [Bacteroidota bacterium]
MSGHVLRAKGDQLEIRYQGAGDVVYFKMFEGLERMLKKQEDGVFVGNLTIPNLAQSIFSYELRIYVQDTTGKMISVPYEPPEPGVRHFVWAGDQRMISYIQADSMVGRLETNRVESQFLEEARDITIYTPIDQNEETPIFYLTDGSVVEVYAPYIDQLIQKKRIRPVKLVGIHSSLENRYQEYVNNGIVNEYFKPHERFFYQEVLPKVEGEIPGWMGQRYAYGFSNGAAFCLYAGINHPDKFEEIVAFSTADYISEFVQPIEFNFAEYPSFYLGAGRYEDDIYENSVAFVPKMQKENIEVEFVTFIAGHDYNVWRYEFLEYLLDRFAK